jgi:hypothetical protein
MSDCGGSVFWCVVSGRFIRREVRFIYLFAIGFEALHPRCTYALIDFKYEYTKSRMKTSDSTRDKRGSSCVTKRVRLSIAVIETQQYVPLLLLFAYS